MYKILAGQTEGVHKPWNSLKKASQNTNCTGRVNYNGRFKRGKPLQHGYNCIINMLVLLQLDFMWGVEYFPLLPL